jgi:hypothetical protein
MNLRISAFFLTLAVLQGCASAAKIENMVPTDVERVNPNSALADQLYISSASGGDETNPMWTSEISAEDFRKALEQALSNSGLLSEMRSSGQYELRVFLDEVDQPFIGLDMTVTTKVTYEVIQRDTRERVFREQITASHTATMGEQFYGVERLRLANEGSAEENIKKFIKLLLELEM